MTNQQLASSGGRPLADANAQPGAEQIPACQKTPGLLHGQSPHVTGSF